MTAVCTEPVKERVEGAEPMHILYGPGMRALCGHRCTVDQGPISGAQDPKDYCAKCWDIGLAEGMVR